MHQQTRMPPRGSSSAASVPQASSPRTSTSKENLPSKTQRERAGSDASGRLSLGSPSTESFPASGVPAESIKKLDQIIQNFYNKVAVLVLNARIATKPMKTVQGTAKVNKWFQLDTDEIEDFRDELKVWKSAGSMEKRPPPMIIELYLDTSRLKENQILVAVDEEGKRWDVREQLNTSETSMESGSAGVSTRKTSEVILERWKVELKTAGSISNEDFGPILPTIYKKAIVYFRSFFITTRLLPCWKFASQGPGKTAHHPRLAPSVRIRMAEERQRPDLLRTPIDGKSNPVTEYVFGDLEIPVGRLRSSVVYRNECNFRIDDSEALLSSRFMGVDENYFRPSMPQGPQVRGLEVGSLRDQQRRPNLGEVTQTYGSLSTFHGENAPGTSPISALRAVRPPGSDTDSPPASLPVNLDPDPPNSLPISRPSTTRPSIRSGDSSGRRPSISFQAFKAGSLTGSPLTRQIDSEVSRPTAGVSSLTQPRNRTSLTAGMPASLRGGPPSTNTQDPPLASSPRPASSSRYSSSFTHRRGRLSVGSTAKMGDDEGSSGRQSLASSIAQPGSGFLAEAEAASPGSAQGDGENISDFLKALDSKKMLKSFEPKKLGDSVANRTVAQLSKFHHMKESHATLTESMTSSVQMNRSSSSSSRQLTSVPGMVAPASMSASSSPGKPVSPHTPHTPAVPSRLSANSIIDNGGRITTYPGRQAEATVPDISREDTITQEGSSAIPIPVSPRMTAHQRRPSSAAQSRRALITTDDDGDAAFPAQRSISLGTDDREPPTISILLGRQLQREREGAASDNLQPAAEIQSSQASSSLQRGSTDDNPPDGLMSSAAPSSSPFGRRRYTGMGQNSRPTPPQSSRGSFNGSSMRATRGDEESLNEEPLVFDLSEMDALGRRSLEEGGRGTPGGSYEMRGTTRRGWS